MNRNINFNIFNDLNISNSSEKELNDFLTEDLLTYSEDKSQSIIYMNQLLDNKNTIIDNHNQSLKNLIQKKENNNRVNNLNRQYNIKNEIEVKNSELKENEIQKRNNDINSNNGNNKDLSALQISLSNLLSDIDSKETIIYRSNNNNNTPIKKIEKNQNSIKQSYLIDISNENSNLNISNNNSKYISNYNINNIYKNINIKNEEQSSACSLCNYSQSLFNSNNNTNNISLNAKKNIISTGNNCIIHSNNNKGNKKTNSYYKEQNIDFFIGPCENSNNKIKNKISVDKVFNDLNMNNKNKKSNTSYKHDYKIQKGENIQLSLISNLNKLYIYNSTNNYDNRSLSINKEHNFTINNSILSSNRNEYYNIIKKDGENLTSLEIIEENNIINKKNGIIKNKKNLINNKNIDIQKDESKKFFYNPKTLNNVNQIKYIHKEKNILKYNKIQSNLNNYNKSESSDIHIDGFHNNKDKHLILSNLNNIDKKNNNKNMKKINNISKNKNKNNSKSYNKNNLKKDDLKNNPRKLCYINKKRKTISSCFNSHNNSYNNNQIGKMRTNTRNIESNDISSKKNYNYCITYNNKKNSESKSKSKSKPKNRNNKNQCITEPSKHNNKKNFFYEQNKSTNVNIIKNDFMNQIKSAQKETTNKLLNKLNNMNNLNNINSINKAALYPIFSKALEKQFDISTENKKKENKNKNVTYKKTSNIKKKNSKNKDNIKSNEINCFTEDINIIKQKKQKKDGNNSHKKIKKQINLITLLNSFNRKERIKKNNKSLFNFGNIFFINQNQMLKKDSDIILNNIQEKNDINKEEKIIIINDNYDSSKLNTLNYSSIKHRPQIINDFSNYKKKGNLKNNDNELNIRNNDIIIKQKRINTDINPNSNNKNNIIIKNKIKDSFKLRKAEGDNGSDIIKGV